MHTCTARSTQLTSNYLKKRRRERRKQSKPQLLADLLRKPLPSLPSQPLLLLNPLSSLPLPSLLLKAAPPNRKDTSRRNPDQLNLKPNQCFWNPVCLLGLCERSHSI
mmetsp:Transcript_37550/g.94409  ORF Transcript_37550/g.94409 Transcript_37550/m.94409 type:complete len:107 (+) Transcript_37550:286-606(+)